MRNSGRSEAAKHMPQKPIGISQSPTLIRRVTVLLNGNPCHTESGRSSRGGPPLGNLRGPWVKLARSGLNCADKKILYHEINNNDSLSLREVEVCHFQKSAYTK